MTLVYDWLMNNNLWERNLLQVISLLKQCLKVKILGEIGADFPRNLS